MGLPSQTQCFLHVVGENITEEQDGLPWRQDHGFSYSVFQPGLLEYVGDQTSPHTWADGG